MQTLRANALFSFPMFSVSNGLSSLVLFKLAEVSGGMSQAGRDGSLTPEIVLRHHLISQRFGES